MPVTPINSSYSNISTFVDSLFSSGVRTITPIDNAINSNEFTAPFSNENDKIVNVLLAAWQNAQGDSYSQNDYNHCPALDKPIIAYLARYIKQNGLEMSIPQLTFVSNSSSGPAYKLDSYTTTGFLDDNSNWDYSVVNDFLHLLINGAHFVNIQSSFSLPNGPKITDLYTDFQGNTSININERKDNSGVLGTTELGNSHYTSITNLNGYYYPNITSDVAPNPCSFILSFLVCPTVANLSTSGLVYETFFQLEGWELPPSIKNAKGSRHDADYQLYKDCYWNISTYGASAYSEKRGTTIFLAPSNWIPKPTNSTFMPPYAGATSPQGWLQTDLITL